MKKNSSSPKWFIFNRLSIRSKLQAIILLCCLIVFLIAGFISYTTARRALRASIYEELTALRARQAYTLTEYFDRIGKEIDTFSKGPRLVDGFKGLQSAYQELQETEISEQQEKELRDYYQKEIIPRLNIVSQDEASVNTYFPKTNAGKNLQYHYIANNPNPIGEKEKLDKADDNSTYSAIHSQVNPLFVRFAKFLEYYDAFMINPQGEIIYTIAKEIDLGTNVKTGVYSDSSLGKVFQEIVSSKDPNLITSIDFANYRPSFDQPAAFVASAIHENGEFLGVLVFQLSIDRINNVMTVNKRWQEIGLNKTGESILVGQDKLLRTDPRLFLEDPEEYYKSLEKIGYTTQRINKIKNRNTPILKQEVDTIAVEKAFQGQKGTELTKDYRGVPTLVSYQLIPVGTSDFSWALITKMDEAEAFAPINRLNYLLLATAAIIIPLMVYLANWLSKLFIDPIKRLVAASRRLSQGETNVTVDIQGQDELGELGQAFNEMSHSLQVQNTALNDKIQENEELLLNLLPPEAAKRFLGGEKSFADSYTDVSIIYGEVEGFSQLAARVTPEESVQLLNQLIGAFDELTESYGVEKLKTVGTTYIAICGLSVPRIDHAKRSVDFAVAMVQAAQKFSQYHNCDVTLDVGIHSGSIVGGIVGKSKFIYEVWGDTMKIAHGIHSSPKDDVIQVSEPVYLALEQLYHFKSLPPISVKGIGEIAIWELEQLSVQPTETDDSGKMNEENEEQEIK
ncbi:MAG: adenylate/guanylate cyclase domain-containing protein [Microcystaceae cyanobacterium]